MKLYLKFNLYVLLFLVSPFVLAQEGIISGMLQDQREESIPFATVSVLKLPDSTLVTGTTTDMEGEFELKPSFTGEIVLRFSAIGYSEVFTPAFRVADASFSKNFGTFTLNEETTMLNEVMINAWKPRITAESGKTVMSVEGNTMAAGNSAYEILTRAPGVSVGPTGEFTINGKQGVSVMIDGRLTYMSSQDVITLLEGMPAENIKEIEVIHNPSAKYDAEGVAGILNINLKKNTLTGISGSVYAGVKLSEQQLFNGGFNLNYKKGKWNSYLNVDLTEDGLYREPEMLREFPSEYVFATYQQKGVDETERFIPSFTLGTEYELNSNHTLGAMANISYQDRLGNWDTQTRFIEQDNSTAMNIDAFNREERSYYNGRFNLNYQWEIDTVGSRLSANFDYARLDKEANSRFINNYYFPADASEDTEYLSNTSISDYDIFAGQVDLNLPLSTNSSLELGLKASNVVSNSDLDAFQGEGADQVEDMERSDRFRYEEEIYAAYAIYNNRLSDTWSLQAGLRAEKTVAESRSFTLDERTSRDYVELFPNVQLEQRVSDNYKLNYAYSRRISRPDYEAFNPFIFFLDPYTLVVGNPELRPQINNTLELSQNLYGKYNLMLSYEFSDRWIAEMPTTDPETGITTIRDENINYYRGFNATLNFPLQPTSFWNSNNNLIYLNQNYNIDKSGAEIEKRANAFMLQSNHQFSLPAGLSLEVNTSYRTKSVFGLVEVGSQFWVDAGLKKSFLNDKLDVTLRATDIFRGQELNLIESYGENTMWLDQYLDNRAVSLNLRYNFSKGSTKQHTRSNTLEEMDRAGAN